MKWIIHMICRFIVRLLCLFVDIIYRGIVDMESNVECHMMVHVKHVDIVNLVWYISYLEYFNFYFIRSSISSSSSSSTNRFTLQLRSTITCKFYFNRLIKCSSLIIRIPNTQPLDIQLHRNIKIINMLKYLNGLLQIFQIKTKL